jgi:hypothetical protein
MCSPGVGARGQDQIRSLFVSHLHMSGIYKTPARRLGMRTGVIIVSSIEQKTHANDIFWYSVDDVLGAVDTFELKAEFFVDSDVA